MCLGHLSEKELGILARRKSLAIKGTSLKTCTHYFIGKHTRVAFHSLGPHGRPQVLDLVHIDVYTMDTKSLGDALYFVTFY